MNGQMENPELLYVAGLVLLSILAAILVVAVVLNLRERKKSKKVLQHMDYMLGQAIDGKFEDVLFDESLLSSVETRLAHFLASSEVSAKNLAEERNKIRELISDISHQTKTPISNILLYTDLLKEQELSEEGKRCVKELGVQSEKLGFLINALVKTSRLETGVLTLQPKEQTVDLMLEEVLRQGIPKAEEKDILLEMEQTGAAMVVMPKSQSLVSQAVFDRKWTEEAIYNIVDNAIKYTGNGGKIGISVKQYELFLRIDISDTGKGIKEEELPKIFGRFYRSSEVSEVEGTGLGLFLARQIITGEGGYIKVKSEIGRGSTFSVFLPR